MALFNKKPTTADEIMALIKGLSGEELDKLGEMLTADDDDNGKPDTEEMIDKAEENIEEKGADEQTKEDRVDESVAEQEKDEGDENSQDAKDRVDESEGEERHEEEEAERKDEENYREALNARIEELEERLAKVIESLENKPFGDHKPELNEGENDDTEESPIMANYFKKANRR
jgi:hypothetical protein